MRMKNAIHSNVELKQRMFAREVERERKISSTDALPTTPSMLLVRIIHEQIFMKLRPSQR